MAHNEHTQTSGPGNPRASFRTAPLLACLLAVGCGGHSSPGGAAASGSTGGGVTAQPNFQPVAFETIERGGGSPRGFSLGAHEVHVATDLDWAYVWGTHSQASLPAVDFSQECVVGTFMGPMGGGSHTTEVVGVWRDAASDDLRALVREFRLGAWKPNTKNLTSPFHIVRCAAAVQPGGSLTVQRQALLDFETIDAGANSAIGANDPTYQGELRVIRDAADLSAFYALHQPGAAPPLVDFTREMVVAVLGGYVPSFGNSVETLRLLHDATRDELRVVHRVNPYRGGAAPPQATETPYQVLRVTLASGPLRPEQQTPAATTALASGVAAMHTGPAEQLVIRDAATFSALWRTRIGGPQPFVDFTRDQVLAAFEDPTTGRTVSVAGATGWEDDELFVQVHTTFFPSLPPSAQASYSMVTTPRTLGPVRFEVRDVTPRP